MCCPSFCQTSTPPCWAKNERTPTKKGSRHCHRSGCLFGKKRRSATGKQRKNSRSLKKEIVRSAAEANGPSVYDCAGEKHGTIRCSAGGGQNVQRDPLAVSPAKKSRAATGTPNEIRRFFQTAANSQNTKNRAIRPLFCPKAPPKYRPFRHKNTAPAFSTNLSAVVQKSFVIFSQYFVTYYCMRPKSIV